MTLNGATQMSFMHNVQTENLDNIRKKDVYNISTTKTKKYQRAFSQYGPLYWNEFFKNHYDFLDERRESEGSPLYSSNHDDLSVCLFTP